MAKPVHAQPHHRPRRVPDSARARPADRSHQHGHGLLPPHPPGGARADPPRRTELALPAPAGLTAAGRRTRQECVRTTGRSPSRSQPPSRWVTQRAHAARRCRRPARAPPRVAALIGWYDRPEGNGTGGYGSPNCAVLGSGADDAIEYDLAALHRGVAGGRVCAFLATQVGSTGTGRAPRLAGWEAAGRVGLPAPTAPLLRSLGTRGLRGDAGAGEQRGEAARGAMGTPPQRRRERR